MWNKKKTGRKAWLKDWMRGASIGFIAEKENLSSRTISREINELLTKPPEIKISSNPKAHLLIDGTFFKRTNCLILYFDNDLRHFDLLRYSAGEKRTEIASDLQCLKDAGVNVVSVTADGKEAIKAAVREIFPKAEFQRCLVHIQRYGETYITQRPKTKAGAGLSAIIKRLNALESEPAKIAWLDCFYKWRKTYSNFLKERSYGQNHWWYTHRSLRRVVFHIERALPDMWRYLDNSSIPKDTNALEGRFTDLKQKFRNHRGLKKVKRKSYFSWYIYLKNLNKKD